MQMSEFSLPSAPAQNRHGDFWQEQCFVHMLVFGGFSLKVACRRSRPAGYRQAARTQVTALRPEGDYVAKAYGFLEQ